MKVGIVGSRDYPDLNQVEKFVATLNPFDEVVTGGARGVDTAAEDAARKYLQVEPTIFLPDWNSYGKGAGFIRNSKIVEHSDVVVAFWDRKSRGTVDTMEKTKKAGKRLIVIDPLGVIEDYSPTNED
jgi:hypothetical protein